MAGILDFIEINRLQKLFQKYQETFNIPVYLLDKNKNILLKFPEDAHQPELDMEPLILKDSCIGYIAMPSGNSESRANLKFIATNLSEIAGMGYEIESLAGEVVRNYEELSLLWRFSSRIGADLNVDNICNILADEVMNICPSTNISIMLVSEVFHDTFSISHNMHYNSLVSEQQDKILFLFPKVSLGTDASRASTMILRTDRGLIEYTFTKKQALTVCDVKKDGRFGGFTYPVTSLLIVPMVVEDIPIGAIIASDKLSGEEFYSNEIKLISSIASECAVSIKKALLFGEIRSMLFSTAEAFSFAIEAKDTYTYGHSKRVSEVVAAIAREAGLPADTITWIKLAALLHDIGKIGTPEDILHKEGSLNHEEMERIQEHPFIGSRMIEHIQRLREMAHWIRHHHEKYDGTGYPSGLKGEKIPLPSRIISIADTFDALTSERPYRKPFSRHEAIKIMKENVGIQFDPVLFGHFEKTIE